MAYIFLTLRVLNSMRVSYESVIYFFDSFFVTKLLVRRVALTKRLKWDTWYKCEEGRKDPVPPVPLFLFITFPFSSFLISSHSLSLSWSLAYEALNKVHARYVIGGEKRTVAATVWDVNI